MSLINDMKEPKYCFVKVVRHGKNNTAINLPKEFAQKREKVIIFKIKLRQNKPEIYEEHSTLVGSIKANGQGYIYLPKEFNLTIGQRLFVVNP